MQPCFFKGTLSLICDPKIVCNIMMQNRSVKVITLDEDNAVDMLSDENNPQVVPGSILLPPIEALWAETDGQRELFNEIYYSHLIQPECMEYIAAMLSAVYQGINMIIYFPDQDSYAIKFLYNHFVQAYGIIISTNIAQPFQYDERSIPAYCNMIFSVKAMSIREYLYWYPLDAIIPDQAYFDIINAYAIYGDNLLDQRQIVDKFHKMLKTGKEVHIPIHCKVSLDE